MTFEQTINYLYNSLPMYQRVGQAAFKKDLANTRLLCQRAGDPQDKFKSLHIAGTNGKGSTAHMLAAILQAAGFRVGLYVSPHLKRFTERIKVNGQEIPEKNVIDFVEKYRSGLDQVQPSFFEMTVVMAFDHFAREKVDLAVVEVGMGGRFDSTNVITPILSVITNIGYDHQVFLGETLPEIAFEKAGIIKSGKPVIVSEWQPEVLEVFEQKARQEQTSIFYAEPEYQIEILEYGLETLTLKIYQSGKLLMDKVRLGLRGEYQLKNLPGVLKSAEMLNQMGYHLSLDHIHVGLAEVKRLTGFNGRWNLLQTNPMVVCDTGHNISSFPYLIDQLQKINHNHLFGLLGMVNDKDPQKLLKLLPSSGYYFFCQANIPRSMPAEKLFKEGVALGLKGEIEPDVNKALRKALDKADKNDLIFIGGSTFVVADLESL